MSANQALFSIRAMCRALEVKSTQMAIALKDPQPTFTLLEVQGSLSFPTTKREGFRS